MVLTIQVVLHWTRDGRFVIPDKEDKVTLR